MRIGASRGRVGRTPEEAVLQHVIEKWTAGDIASLAALGKAIKAGETTTFEEFETADAEKNGADNA